MTEKTFLNQIEELAARLREDDELAEPFAMAINRKLSRIEKIKKEIDDIEAAMRDCVGDRWAETAKKEERLLSELKKPDCQFPNGEHAGLKWSRRKCAPSVVFQDGETDETVAARAECCLDVEGFDDLFPPRPLRLNKSAAKKYFAAEDLEEIGLRLVDNKYSASIERA